MNDRDVQMESLLSTSLKCTQLEAALPPILGCSWVLPYINPEIIDAKLLEYYPTLNRELTIWVSGKEFAPDPAAFALAASTLTALPKYIASIKDLDTTQWNLTGLIFPYQKRKVLWYSEFRTEYDGDLAIAFTGDTAADVTPCNANWPESSLVGVPYTVVSLVHLISKNRIAVPGFEHILDRIKDERIFGTELIVPLIEIVERNAAVFEASIYRHILTKLKAIEMYAE